MLRKSVLKQDNFSGGLITKASELALNLSQSPDCLNVHSDIYKSLQKRNGYDNLNTVSRSATANGIYNYRRTDTAQYLVSLWGTALKKMDVVSSAWDGGWDAVSVDANKGTTLSSDIMHNTDFSTDCIITTEARDIPQRYDPNDNANYTDLDWESSHCHVTGDDSTISTGTGAYLKITIDGTAFDNVDVRSKNTVALVVTAINAHSNFSAKGFAYVDSSGYLDILSNTRGSGGSVVVADGTSDTGDGQGEATEVLFDGTTATGTTIGTNIAPSGKYCIVWHDYTWIVNTSAQPDRIYYSASSDHKSWTATHYQTIITPGDVGITGLATLRGRMYAFKKLSIHRVTYLGGTPLLDVREVKTGMGTASPRTIRNVEIPGQGEVIIFLGTDLQLYMFDGYIAVPISEPVSVYNGISNYCMVGDDTSYGINSGQLVKCHSVNYSRKHWYILFFCLGDDTTPADAFVYDYYAKSFWPFHFDDTLSVSCIADNGAGQRRVYVAGTNYAWLFDTTNADDEDDINGYWSSGKLDMGSEVQKKDIRNINLTTSSAAVTPSFQYRTDWQSSYSTAQTLTTATREHTFDVPRFEELLQWKFSDNSDDAAFELIRVSTVASVERIAK